MIPTPACQPDSPPDSPPLTTLQPSAPFSATSQEIPQRFLSTTCQEPSAPPPKTSPQHRPSAPPLISHESIATYPFNNHHRCSSSASRCGCTRPERTGTVRPRTCSVSRRSARRVSGHSRIAGSPLLTPSRAPGAQGAHPLAQGPLVLAHLTISTCMRAQPRHEQSR